MEVPLSISLLTSITTSMEFSWRPLEECSPVNEEIRKVKGEFLGNVMLYQLFLFSFTGKKTKPQHLIYIAESS